MDITDRFAAAVARPDPEVPLDEVALLVAAHAYPGLDVDGQLRRLDDLAARCPEPTLDGLRELLFGVLGFDGARADYYDPRNSYLNDVLDRRRGLPILLSLLAMEVGRRVGVPLAGVGMPGHFLVRDRVDPEVFIDPFAGGVLLDRAGCEARYHEVQGALAPFDPTWLDPTPRLDIVARVLANLRVAHTRARRPAALAWVLGLRVLLPGADPAQRQALAAVLARVGRVTEAAAELDRVAEEVTDPETAVRARAAAQEVHDPGDPAAGAELAGPVEAERALVEAHRPLEVARGEEHPAGQHLHDRHRRRIAAGAGGGRPLSSGGPAAGGRRRAPGRPSRGR